MTERWTAIPLDGIAGYADEGRPRWHMVRSALDIEAFGVNAWRATAAGQELIGEHDELGQGAGGHEELYLVVSGHATFTVDGETLEAPARTVVFVKDPDGAALGDRARGGNDGARRRRQARRRIRRLRLGTFRRGASLLVDGGLGHARSRCCSASTTSTRRTPGCSTTSRVPSHDQVVVRGRSRISTEAVALEPRFGENAATDPDFDTIRDDPRFSY